MEHTTRPATWTARSFAHKIFSCKKLTVLKLNGAFDVDLPVSINLPNLKAIHLFGVTLPGDEFVRNLSVNCPALKKIIIFECFGIQTLSVDSGLFNPGDFTSSIERWFYCDKNTKSQVPFSGWHTETASRQ